MSDKFDPYREALIVEVRTVWPADFAALPQAEKDRIRQQLHRDPAACAQLEYVRLHTGFCRQITVSAADVERLRSADQK